MYNLKELTNLTEEQQSEMGVLFTMKEILQQPQIWKETYKVISIKRNDIKSFLSKCGVYDQEQNLNIYLTGAGSSEFAGNAAAPFLQKSWNRQVVSVGTTDFISHTEYFILKGKKNLVVSLGRSGNSPESVATFQKAKEYDPEVMQINICCNKDSKMTELCTGDKNTLNIILPEATHDKSLVMTSSFTSMVLTLLSLAYMDDMERFGNLVDLASEGAEKIIGQADLIQKFITRETSRVLYLGTAEIKGCAQEARLKSQEMTDGKILSDFNSYLGLRHGPQVFADKTALITALLSSDPIRRKYEIDLLKEMQDKKQGSDYLLICDRKSKGLNNIAGKIIEIFPKGETINDALNVLPFMLVGQLNGFFKSIQIGHKPDSPSESGTINRVVSGVEIY